jgi:hypothetical protein
MMGKKIKRRQDCWDDPKAPKATNRKASASALVRDEEGRVLLLRRPDNGLWTIPTGGVKKNETVAEAAVRESRPHPRRFYRGPGALSCPPSQRARPRRP